MGWNETDFDWDDASTLIGLPPWYPLIDLMNAFYEKGLWQPQNYGTSQIGYMDDAFANDCKGYTPFKILEGLAIMLEVNTSTVSIYNDARFPLAFAVDRNSCDVDGMYNVAASGSWFSPVYPEIPLLADFTSVSGNRGYFDLSNIESQIGAKPYTLEKSATCSSASLSLEGWPLGQIGAMIWLKEAISLITLKTGRAGAGGTYTLKGWYFNQYTSGGQQKYASPGDGWPGAWTTLGYNPDPSSMHSSGGVRERTRSVVKNNGTQLGPLLPDGHTLNGKYHSYMLSATYQSNFYQEDLSAVSDIVLADAIDKWCIGPAKIWPIDSDEKDWGDLFADPGDPASIFPGTGYQWLLDMRTSKGFNLIDFDINGGFDYI